MVKATHRSTVLSLLPFDPGEVQQELIATLTAANVGDYWEKEKFKSGIVLEPGVKK